MGEQADLHLQDMLDSLDQESEECYLDEKYCKYCNKGNLYWGEHFIRGKSSTEPTYEVRWRLFDMETRKLHVCKQYIKNEK